MRKFCWFFIIVLVISLSVIGCKEESGNSHKAQNFPSDPAEMDKSTASAMDGGTDVDAPDPLPEYDGPSTPNGWSTPTEYTEVSDVTSPIDIFTTLSGKVFVAEGYRGLKQVDLTDPENPTFIKLYFESGEDEIPFRAMSVFADESYYLDGGDEYLWVVENREPTQRLLDVDININQQGMSNPEPRIYRIQLHETPDPGNGKDVYSEEEYWVYELSTVTNPYSTSEECIVEFMTTIAVIDQDSVLAALNPSSTSCLTDEMFAWFKFQDNGIVLEGVVQPNPSFLMPIYDGVEAMTTTYMSSGRWVDRVDTYATVGNKLYALLTENILCDANDVCTMEWEHISGMPDHYSPNNESLLALSGDIFMVEAGGWWSQPSYLYLIGGGMDEAFEIGEDNNPGSGLSMFGNWILAAFPFESQVMLFSFSESGESESSEDLGVTNGLTGIKEFHLAKDYETSGEILLAHDQVIYWDHWLEEISGDDGSATGSFLHHLEDGGHGPQVFQFAYENDVTKMVYAAKPEIGQIMKIPAGTDIDPVTYLDYELLDYNMVSGESAPSTLEPYAISINPSTETLYFGNDYSDPAILSIDLDCEFLPAPGGGQCVDYHIKRSDLSGDAYTHFVGIADIDITNSPTGTYMDIVTRGGAGGDVPGYGRYIYHSEAADTATLFFEPADYSTCDSSWTDERVVAWAIRDLEKGAENSVPYIYVSAWPVFGTYNTTSEECELIYDHGSVVFRLNHDAVTPPYTPRDTDIFVEHMDNAWGLAYELYWDGSDNYDVLYFGDQYENVIYKTQKAWPPAK